MPDSLDQRLVSAEELSIAWIETRTEREMELFEDLVQITHDIIDEAFSYQVIKPGETVVTQSLRVFERVKLRLSSYRCSEVKIGSKSKIWAVTCDCGKEKDRRKRKRKFLNKEWFQLV